MAITVFTLNLWHDSGPWERRRELIRSWLDRVDPDLIGFQEVLRGRGVDQAAELLDGRGFHLDYVAASGWRDGLAFGNAVASRWPITGREERKLPDSGDGETRAAISVNVDSPHGEIGFTCTHLNWKFNHGWVRERQVVAVCDLALRRRPRGGLPPILVGDLNAEPDSAEIRYVAGLQSLEGRSVAFLDAWRQGGDGSAGITWSNRNPYAASALEPDRRIDYVFVGLPQRDGGGQILRAHVVCDAEQDGVWPSDHFGVAAKLRTQTRKRR